MALYQALMSQGGGGGGRHGGYPAPPNSFNQSFSGMKRNDGADLFRLMSKANKYSGQQGNRRKKNKADQYAFMTGAMLHQNGIQTPDYQIYHDAYNHGPKHGMQPQMLDDFRSGTMQQKRHTRRQQNGRYNGRDKGQNQKKGKKNHSDSMFDFFDSDTSSSSEEE